jgi:hypothetical protein
MLATHLYRLDRRPLDLDPAHDAPALRAHAGFGAIQQLADEIPQLADEIPQLADETPQLADDARAIDAFLARVSAELPNAAGSWKDWLLDRLVELLPAWALQPEE